MFFGCENLSLPLDDLQSEKFGRPTQYVYNICMSIVEGLFTFSFIFTFLCTLRTIL